MIETVARLVVGAVFAAITWIVVIPLVFAVYTPVALVLAMRGPGTCFDNLRSEYRRLWRFWKEWGIAMVPPWS